MTIAVTFDFHDTLAHCDQWFEVEVRSLVPEVLRRLDERNGTHLAQKHGVSAVQAYRALRSDVIACGREVDAYVATQRILEQLDVTADQFSVRDVVDDVMRAALPSAQPVPGAIDAVRFLSDRDVPIAVVSSAAHHDFLEWTLKQFGIRDRFVDIISSAACGHYKSSVEIYTTALQALDVEPQNCVHIGDSLRFDVTMARSAGMRTIWLQREHGEIEGAHPDLTLRTLEGAGPAALQLLGVSV